MTPVLLVGWELPNGNIDAVGLDNGYTDNLIHDRIERTLERWHAEFRMTQIGKNRLQNKSGIYLVGRSQVCFKSWINLDRREADDRIETQSDRLLKVQTNNVENVQIGETVISMVNIFMSKPMMPSTLNTMYYSSRRLMKPP